MASVSIERPPADFETPGNPAAFSPSTHFQLYIKLLDGTGLKRSGVENVDGVVEMSLERGGSELVKKSSRVFKMNENPSWNEEWVVTKVENRGGEVILKFGVYDHRRILSNVLLGEAIVDVSGMNGGEMKEYTLELRRGGGGKEISGSETEGNPDSPKLRVMLQKTELKGEDMKEATGEARMEMKRLSSLRIVLERLSYYPGEQVRGMVISNIGSEKRMRGIRLHAVGQSQVTWSERTGQYSSRTFIATHSLFDETVTLFGNGRMRSEGEVIAVEKQKFCFPFSFTLPTQIPPSFRGTIGFIQYRVTAYCDLRFVSNKCATVPFTVLAHYHSSIPQALVANSGSETHTLFRKNVMEIPLSISAPAVVEAGQMIPVSVAVDHTVRSSSGSGSKPIVSIIVELVQNISYKASHCGRWEQRRMRRPVCSSYFGLKAPENSKHSYRSSNGTPMTMEHLVPIIHGQERKFKVLLPIPHRTPPTIFAQLSPVLEVSYTVEVTLYVEGNVLTGAKNKKALPVIVSRPHMMPDASSLSPTMMKVFGDGTVSVDASGARQTTQVANLSGSISGPPVDAVVVIDNTTTTATIGNGGGGGGQEILNQNQERVFVLENNGDEFVLLEKEGEDGSSGIESQTPTPMPEEEQEPKGEEVQKTSLSSSSPSPPPPHDTASSDRDPPNLTIPNQAAHPSAQDAVMMTPSFTKGLYGEILPMPTICASQQVVFQRSEGGVGVGFGVAGGVGSDDQTSSSPAFSMPSDSKTVFIVNPLLSVLPDLNTVKIGVNITPPGSIAHLSNQMIQHIIFYHSLPSDPSLLPPPTKDSSNDPSPPSPGGGVGDPSSTTLIQEYRVPFEFNTPFSISEDISNHLDDDSNSPPTQQTPTKEESTSKDIPSPLPPHSTPLSNPPPYNSLYSPSAIGLRIYRPSMLVPSFNPFLPPALALSRNNLIPVYASSLPVLETLNVAQSPLMLFDESSVASSSSSTASSSTTAPSGSS